MLQAEASEESGKDVIMSFAEYHSQLSGAAEEGAALLDSVDARTGLAGSNKMEILLFSLGTNETFGINVFKVREVMRVPEVTRAPDMPPSVEGMVSLRVKDCSAGAGRGASAARSSGSRRGSRSRRRRPWPARRSR